MAETPDSTAPATTAAATTNTTATTATAAPIASASLTDPASSAAPAVLSPSPPASSPENTRGSPPRSPLPTDNAATAAAPNPDQHEEAVESVEVVEADEGFATDDASTIEDRISNYTASLTSSVVDYPEEYGRRYHAFRPGTYSFPNDEVEMDRLDMAHALMVRAIGSRLFLAPLEREKVHRILDIGTGTGIWAVEMGDIFENAEVFGIDLSAIQPEWVPPNVRFEIDDVESPWVVQEKYDYIMCRYMAASIADWPRLIKNIYDHLNPGGWAEFQDMSTEYYSDDGTYTPQHATYDWNQTFVETLRSIGRDPCPGPQLEGWVRAHGGFDHVFHQRFKTPIGPWAKERHYRDQGMLNLAQILEGLEGFSMKLFCGVLGRTREEVLVQLAGVRKELKSDTFHSMLDLHVVFGQKPPLRAESAEES
ncbi:umta methyltransferase family protein [Colletotrichum tabaci]|uniref:Umta methyltransferase family protein n=1 Tax=Colletotrichum tabaci TaxID=1209068 RepID=A0AAV9TI84_9PEZI